MKFKYKLYNQEYLRPVIPIEIKYEDKKVGYEVLIDSGADMCLFDAGIGELLGIDIKSGKKRKVVGVAGVSKDYYLHYVTIDVGGWEFEVEVGFYPNMPKNTYGIVGQHGFFNLFIVKFDLMKTSIELKQRSGKNK